MFSFRMVLILVYLGLLGGCNGSGSSSGSSCSSDACGICSANQTGVKICSITATPTVSEKITLKNYDSLDQNLTGWSLWDKNAEQNGSGEKSLSGSITAGSTLEVASLPFQINDSGEVIYLKDNSGGLIDQRGN